MLLSTFILVVIGWPMCIYTPKLMSLDRQLILSAAFGLLTGVFTLNNSVFDVFLLCLFGTIGCYMSGTATRLQPLPSP
jgi:TctA family transporter